MKKIKKKQLNKIDHRWPGIRDIIIIKYIIIKATRYFLVVRVTRKVFLKLNQLIITRETILLEENKCDYANLCFGSAVLLSLATLVPS